MKKLTDDELREPDVIFIFTYAQIDSLPEPARKEIYGLLNPYIGYDSGYSYTYRIPAYLAHQIQEIASLSGRKLQSGDSK